MNKTFPIRIVYFLSFVLAFCSLIYELLLAQTISFYTANTSFWYAMTIGFYLAAMGMGAYWCSQRGHSRDVWNELINIECFLSVIGASCVLSIHFMHMLFMYFSSLAYPEVGAILFFAVYFMNVLCVGVLTGLELPLLILIGQQLAKEKSKTNRILSADYFGSLLAGLTFPLVFVPYVELSTIGFFVAFLNLMVASIILIKSDVVKDMRRRIGYKLRWAVIFLCGSVFLGGIVFQDPINQYFLKKFYYHYLYSNGPSALLAPVKDHEKVERYHSAYHKIDIIKVPEFPDSLTIPLKVGYSLKWTREEGFPRNYRLFLNGDFQFSTSYEEFYHEYFVHVPVQLNDQVPKRILLLGGGDGLAVREMLKYKEVESITVVDIDPVMVRLAREHPILKKANRNALNNPKVTVLTQDAFHFVRNHKQTYDAVYVDISIPNDYNLSKLYSFEFFQFVKRLLTDQGFMVFEAPTSGLMNINLFENVWELDKRNQYQKYFSTLKRSGYGAIVPYIVNLEQNNRIVKELIKGFHRNLGVPEPDDVLIEQILRKYADDLRGGFIFAKAQDSELNYEFKDREVKHYVLNQKRYHLSFAMDHLFRDKNIFIDKSVNYIMRPVFPYQSFWWIKRP